MVKAGDYQCGGLCAWGIKLGFRCSPTLKAVNQTGKLTMAFDASNVNFIQSKFPPMEI